jgi:TRAP-type uncharacterized transport system substrate-binding protein
MTQLDPQRPLHLRFQGDWGGVNLTRICGWIAGEVYNRAGAGTGSVIRTGRGMADNLYAVGRGEVDAAVATPAGFARMARAGLGLFADEPLPTLRAIGSLPHRDALLVALPAQLGISTFTELRERQPALRLALSPNDGISFMGFGAEAVLRASGIEPEDIVSWGGELITHEQPQQCVAEVMTGNADAIIHEAIMTRWWHDMTASRKFSFLSLEDDAAATIERDLQLDIAEVSAGYLPGLDQPVRAVDFRDWMVVVREDMRDDVAGLIAAILVETSDLFERQYTHLPVRFSPLDFPITAARLAATPIPLHPGAEAYYRSAGVL